MPQVAPGGRGRGVFATTATQPSVWDAEASDSGDEQQAQAGAVDQIQSRLFEKYMEACDELSGSEDEERDAVFAQGLARVAEWVSGGTNTMCLICLGTIKPAEAVWHCSTSCFAVFHLGCAQEWARSQMDAAALRASNAAGSGPPREALEWGCPKCRAAYPSAQVPRVYTCFCGKAQDPEWDPWIAPHTCGEVCERPLPGSCSHTCRLLCHPGPCPPCPLVVDASCHCGKRREKRRCGQQLFSCRATCGRRRACGHPCEATCHEGDCPPCGVVDSYPCQCGAEARRVPCSERGFQCARVCGKALPCGRHSCERKCHDGSCGGCPLEGRRSCPCGATVYGELRCDEPAPSCGGTCGKTLGCGRHSCQERCHTGPCGKVCRDVVSKPCRCGRTQREVLCSAEVLCDLKCTNMRACGRHACRRRCCDGTSCPPCDETCGRRLRCGNHKCPAPCHSGPCRPCPLTFTVSCACGRTRHTLPCGAEAKAVPPRCSHPCLVPPVCRHAAAQQPHRCHFGACPPCRRACGTALACGHTCGADGCHDTHPPPVALWEQPKPPKNMAQATAATGASSKRRGGEPQEEGAVPPPPPAQVAAAAAAALAAGSSSSSGSGPGSGALTPCPPCMAPVTLCCFGAHTTATQPCHQAAHFACGTPCGQPLPCGNHSCTKACHVLQTAVLEAAAAAAVPGFNAEAAAAVAQSLPNATQPCETCERPCSKARSGCKHPCPQRCHPGACPACVVPRTQACHCGKTTLSFPCHELTEVLANSGGSNGVSKAAVAAAAAALCCGKPCHRALPGCQHPCRALCHSGNCDDGACQEEVTVRCECRRQKQKWGCGRVRAALAKATGSVVYDSGSAGLKLLPCDAECAAQLKSKKPAADEASVKATVQPPTAAAAPTAATAAKRQQEQQQSGAAGAASAKRMSRAEREALAAQRVEQQLAEERWRKRVQLAKQVGSVAAAAVAVLVLVHLLVRLLSGDSSEL